MLIGPRLLDPRTALKPAKCVQTGAGIAFIDFAMVHIRAAPGDGVDDSATSPAELGRSSAGRDGDVIDLLTVDQKVVGSRAGSVNLNCLTVGETAVGDNLRTRHCGRHFEGA